MVFLTFVYSLLHNRAAWYSLWCMSAAMFSLIISFGIRERARARARRRDEPVDALSGDHFNSTPKAASSSFNL
jgi:hypothetical protein